MNENNKKKILFTDFESIKTFFNIVLHYEEDIDLSKERYVVDAKSLMGIFSLDISKPLDVTIHTDNEEVIKAFFDQLKENNLILKEND